MLERERERDHVSIVMEMVDAAGGDSTCII